MLTHAVRALGLDGAIMVTASHNPPAENGFKILLGTRRVHGRSLDALVQGPCRRRAGGVARHVSVIREYVGDLIRAAGGVAALKIAWDCGSGATGPVVERLAPFLPGEHILLNTAVDGAFPAHHPDPA